MTITQPKRFRCLLTTTTLLCLCALARAATPAPFTDGERGASGSALHNKLYKR